MRVAVIDSQVAFFHGGAEMLAAKLVQAVRELGHDVELVRIPFNPAEPRDILRAIDFASGADLDRWIARPDVVIGLRFPGYLVRHGEKRVWLLHQLRQYYEYYEKTAAEGSADGVAEASVGGVAEAREAVARADREALSAAKVLRPQSRRIAERLEQWNGVRAQPPLYPPLPRDDGFFTGGQERYIYCPSRLERHKRQSLLIEAMTHVRGDVKAIIAGEGGAYYAYLEQVERLGLRDRVLLCGKVSHEVHATWYAHSLGVFFGPDDEDYGFVTLEAMLSGKPVITCTDSGAPLEFVRDGVEGFVIQPDARALAACIEKLAADPKRARDMGMAGQAAYRALGLDWKTTAQALLEGRTA
jgi:glycosyltransferase involved in cell wall biosynthesis